MRLPATTRRSVPLTVVALALSPLYARAAEVAPPTAFRLAGLERLYFEAVSASDMPDEVSPLLPDRLKPLKGATDRRLPIARRSIVLREVVDYPYPRMNRTWWAVYEEGQRGEIWRYSPMGENLDMKRLVSQRIESIRRGRGGRVEIRLDGSMFRPQGAWFLTGKVLTFDVSGAGLSLAHLRNAYGFFRGYDLGEISPLGVKIERIVDDVFVERTLDPAPDGVLARCGFRNPTDTDGGPQSWDELERVAACVTAAPGHRTTRRNQDEPSFSERGGNAR